MAHIIEQYLQLTDQYWKPFIDQYWQSILPELTMTQIIDPMQLQDFIEQGLLEDCQNLVTTGRDQRIEKYRQVLTNLYRQQEQEPQRRHTFDRRIELHRQQLLPSYQKLGIEQYLEKRINEYRQRATVELMTDIDQIVEEIIDQYRKLTDRDIQQFGLKASSNSAEASSR